jgi:hypothetical protein
MAYARSGFLDSVLAGQGSNTDELEQFLAQMDGGGGMVEAEPEPTFGARSGGFVGEAGPAADDSGRVGETPREREEVRTRMPAPDVNRDEPKASGPGEQVGTYNEPGATPPRPRTPSPQAGQSQVQAPPPAAPSGGLMPFSPLPSPSVGSMATPRLRGLYGSQGGLTGGGLGVPLDPQSNQASDPIETLLSTLTSKRRTL